ncbi:MAG: hypothetical protein ACSHYF_16965 [Verrucomicrobiaceae bacterium]
MIENIRKYTGLMIVVLVLLFIGLVFLENSFSSAFAGKPAMEVAGQKISEKEFRRKAINPLEIATKLGNSFLPQEAQELAKEFVTDDVITFSRGFMIQSMNIALEGDRPDHFLANRIAVQKAGIEYGATPGPEEVERFVENVLFAKPEGGFDQEAYAEFIEKRLGSLGIGIRGFNEYIRDLLTAQNLAKLISGGVSMDRDFARSLFLNEKQQIDVQQIALDSTNYEAEQNPTEEEIKAYWEENKARYNTDERRKISYVFIEPDWDAVLADSQKKAAEAKQKAEEARKKLEEEAKKAEEAAEKANQETTPAEQPVETPAEGAEGQPGQEGESAPEAIPAVTTPAPVVEAPAPAPAVKSAKDQLKPLEKMEALKGEALNQQVAALYNPLVDLSTKKTFAELAAELGMEIITTDFFTRADPPKELERFATNSPLGTLADIAFAIPADAKDDQRISEPYETSDGWFVGQLEEAELSRPLTYEEAKVNATVDLKKQLAREKLKVEAEATHAKLNAALAEGKSFEEAAKELELTVTKLEKLAVSPNRGAAPSVPPAFEAARFAEVGTIASPQFIPGSDNPERALIVFVENRQVTVDEAFSNQLDNYIQSQSSSLQLATFQNWLRDRYRENEVQTFINLSDQ